MVSSTVSSKILSRMAKAEGFKYQECLTGYKSTISVKPISNSNLAGFKYIGNTALDIERAEGNEVLFGYEEAIGFMFGRTVRDKDGIAAAVRLLSLTKMLILITISGCIYYSSDPPSKRG